MLHMPREADYLSLLSACKVAWARPIYIIQQIWVSLLLLIIQLHLGFIPSLSPMPSCEIVVCYSQWRENANKQENLNHGRNTLQALRRQGL